jgi:hypothetical protein
LSTLLRPELDLLHRSKRKKGKHMYLYCIHCYRCFEQDVTDTMDAGIVDRKRPVDEDGGPWLKCPYQDCDGSPIDFWDWNKFLKDAKLGDPKDKVLAGYPEIPAPCIVYDMYPKPSWKPRTRSGSMPNLV